MRFDEAYSGNVFIRSHSSYEESQAVIYGMPMDWTVSFRPGSRFGPARIREVSIGLEEYSPYLDRLLEDIKYFDAGDIPLPLETSKAAWMQSARSWQKCWKTASSHSDWAASISCLGRYSRPFMKSTRTW